jgi:glucose/mannose transport system permease protein
VSAPPLPRHRHPAAAIEARAPQRHGHARPRRRRRAWGGGLLLVSPSLLAIGIFIYGFIGWNVRVSFSSWRGLTPRYDFIGLHNYLALWSDERWRIDVRNVVVFTAVLVAGALALGFAMALMLDRGTRGEGWLRGVFLFPMALSFIATGIVWRWLLDNGKGAETTGLNKLLDGVGLGFLGGDWHRSNSPWAIAAVALPAGWALSGYVMALFLAGMRTVPEDIREAARIDGASETQVFWFVTRPLLRPALLSAMVILIHISLKSFDLLYALDQRNLKIDTPSLYMWFTTFDGGFLSRGATIATLLLIGVALVMGPYIWYSVRTERSR